MIISSLLYNLLQTSLKHSRLQGKFMDFTLGIVLFGISSITTNYTNILGIYGGGGKLLGGTYLLIFYIGMILTKYDLFPDNSPIKNAHMLVIFGVSYFGFWRLLCAGYQPKIDCYFPLGVGFNPPSISFIIYALFMFCFCYGFFSLCSRNKILSIIPIVFGYLGQHTLYIFLYHLLFLNLLSKYIIVENIYIKRIVYFPVMIIAPIIVEYTFALLLKKISTIN